MSAVVHATAVVDPDAQLGAEVEIGPYCVIGPRVEIGDGCRLGPHVVLERNVRLGQGVAVGLRVSADEFLEGRPFILHRIVETVDEYVWHGRVGVQLAQVPRGVRAKIRQRAAFAARRCDCHCRKFGRDERIRTSDPHTPSVMRYQAALRPDRPRANSDGEWGV